MRKKIAAAILSALLALSVVGAVLADTTGYEGQPGNQSENNGNNQGGTQGYEGQPGNQSNGQ